jgi:hypothetical protein
MLGDALECGDFIEQNYRLAQFAIEPLEKACAQLEQRERYLPMEKSTGSGSWPDSGLGRLEYVQELARWLLARCREHPKARLSIR